MFIDFKFNFLRSIMVTFIISTEISLMSHSYLIAANGTPGEWIVSKEHIRIDLIF
jgi:hypothetical protein